MTAQANPHTGGRAFAAGRGKTKLPVPTDFADRAAKARNPALCAHYGVCVQIIFRWRRETGVRGKARGGKAPMLIPADFADAAARMRNSDLAARFGVNTCTIGRWRREAGVTGYSFAAQQPRPSARKTMPADFRETATRRAVKDLAADYGCHVRIVRRWLREAGMKGWRQPPAPKPAKPRTQPFDRARTVTGYRKMPVARKRTHVGANHFVRDSSTEGQAADVLRKYAAVYRCTERGAADQKGGRWRYGNAVLTGAELIERAERHGFGPDGWRRIGLAIAGHEMDKAARDAR